MTELLAFARTHQTDVRGLLYVAIAIAVGAAVLIIADVWYRR